MRTTVAGALALVILAAPAAAQNDCIKDFRMPAAGTWAEYLGNNNKDTTTMRYAVVGTETREGTEMKWLELRMTGADSSKTMVYQMLTPGNPAELGRVQEIVFKTGNKPAMKMSPMMMGMLRGQLEKSSLLSNLCEGVTVVGEETVEVPAGSFKTVHLHNAKHESDAWVSTKVPFYMVKSTGKKFEMALTRSGAGAKSSITETPQEMPGFGPKKSK